MSKRDKPELDYDKNILRFVGNMIAGANWQNKSQFGLENMVDEAIKFARYAREQLRKEQQ